MAQSVSALADTHLTREAFTTFCNSVQVAALKIDYCVDIAKPEISFDVFLQGTRIGGGVLNPQSPSVTIEGAISGIKVRATLTADFERKQVSYEIEICVPILGCAKYAGVLFSWLTADFTALRATS